MEINTLNLSNVDGSLLISFVALFLSLFTYFLHDRRLKKQEHLINDYQLQKISKEQDEHTKAVVKANIIKKNGGKRVIKIFNAGKSIARNVNIEILQGKDGIHTNDLNELFPYEFLNPQESTEFLIFLFEGPTAIIKIRTTWDDDFAFGNTHEQILTL